MKKDDVHKLVAILIAIVNLITAIAVCIEVTERAARVVSGMLRLRKKRSVGFGK